MKKIFFFLFVSICLRSYAQNVFADPTFTIGTGFDGRVYTTVIQPDGKIVVGGSFFSFNGVSRNNIARLNADGTLDITFDPGSGFSGGNTFNGGPFQGVVYTLSIQTDGKLIAGGQFVSFNGNAVNSIARINTNGSFDSSFNTGIGFTTTSQNSFTGLAEVWSINVFANGKIIVGGWFENFNGTSRNDIALLNSNGSLDLTFDPGSGFTGGPYDGWVKSLKVQSNGKILVGGQFSAFNGVSSNNVTRLNADGTLDTTFDPVAGFNSDINSTYIQPDGKIIVGGEFTSYNGISRSKIARLNINGSLDTSFDPASGFDSAVESIALQSDGKIIVSGGFSIFNGITRNTIARLNANGSLDNSFDPVIGANGQQGYEGISTLTIQSDGKIIAGGYFDSFNGVPRNNIARLMVCATPMNETISVSSCAPYLSLTNQSYSQSSVYNEVIQNIYGCDSIHRTINLTILNSISSFTATICDGDTYFWNGQLYSQYGQYTQTLTNQFGCDSVVTLNLNVNYNDYISITPNPSFGNAPLNVAFANQTNDFSNYNFTWYFGDGTSQQSNAPFLNHTYTQDGYADVTIVAQNITTGCTSTQIFNDMVFVIGGVTCTHTATINQTGSLTACSGDSVLISCNTNPSFSYQWNRNGVPVSGATSSSIYALLSGSYTVTIYQNNCPVTSSGISVTINPLPSIPTITSTGTIIPCSGGSMTLTAPSGFVNYLWNTGSTSSLLVVSQSGSYSVTVTNANGCSKTSAPYIVNASFMQSPNVCIVGMDSLTNENRIVWEKPITTGIDSFYVYKETNVSDVYTKIGATNYPDLAVFLDQNSNPAVQAYRYKLAILDTCGTETPLSDFHKTIHLTINQGVGNSWNLIWSHYEGLTFGSYRIYRGTSLSNMSLLTTIQSNLNSYTDLTPPTGPLYYQIEVVNPNNCDPTKIMNYSLSRSNIVNNGVIGISEEIMSTINVYPNPTNDKFTLNVSNDLLGKGYVITDFSGRIIAQGKINALIQTLDVQEISKGAYFLQIDKSTAKAIKIIKQ